MNVDCEVSYEDVENEQGRMMPGVVVTCGRCGQTSQAYGQHERSVARCMMNLKENCPNKERNFYENSALGGLGPRTAPASPAKQRPVRKVQSANMKHGGHVVVTDAPAGETSAPVLPPIPGVPPLIANNSYCIIKCATTGISKKTDEVVQIGLIQIDGGRPLWRASINIKPTVPIPLETVELHGLSEQRLQYAPPFAAVLPTIHHLIGGRTLLGYNLKKFDLQILERQRSELTLNQRAGVAPWSFNDFSVVDVIDLERHYAQFAQDANDKQRHGLSDACVRWGVNGQITYDTLLDAKLIWGVFAELCSRFSELASADLNSALVQAPGDST